MESGTCFLSYVCHHSTRQYRHLNQWRFAWRRVVVVVIRSWFEYFRKPEEMSFWNLFSKLFYCCCCCWLAGSGCWGAVDAFMLLKKWPSLCFLWLPIYISFIYIVVVGWLVYLLWKTWKYRRRRQLHNSQHDRDLVCILKHNITTVSTRWLACPRPTGMDGRKARMAS